MRKKLTAALIAVCMAAVGCGNARTGTAADGQTAVEVNGEAVSFREWNFYLRMNQMEWEKGYLETYGDEMWSRETDADGTTLANELKDEVLEIIYRLCLTNQHAEEYGAVLNEDDTAQLREQAADFMDAYNAALLDYAGADEDFVFGQLCRSEISNRVLEAVTADYDPQIDEEDVRREGICYVLLSTTGLRDNEGNFTPFSDEEVERRTSLAWELSERARKSGDLKAEAQKEGLTPIESDMGKSNDYDGQEPRMLDAARALAVGDVSDPVETEEGWFVVQHTSGYDEDGTEYWRDYLTDLARDEERERIFGEWRDKAEITLYQEVLDRADVKIVLKELPSK